MEVKNQSNGGGKSHFLINVSFAKHDYNGSDFHLKVDFIATCQSLSHDVMERWSSMSLNACIQDWNC